MIIEHLFSLVKEGPSIKGAFLQSKQVPQKWGDRAQSALSPHFCAVFFFAIQESGKGSRHAPCQTFLKQSFSLEFGKNDRGSGKTVGGR